MTPALENVPYVTIPKKITKADLSLISLSSNYCYAK